MTRPGLLTITVALSLFVAVSPARSQQGGVSLDALLDRIVGEQDALALQEPDDFYSYYELGTFDTPTFDQRSATDALNADLPGNPALQCSYAAYPFGEPSRVGIVRVLSGAGQTLEAQRIAELPADRLIGAVMRSWEGFTGDILDCNVSLARLYFDNGRVLTAYYDGRGDLAATRPNVPSMLQLAPLEDFRNDRTRTRPGVVAGGD